MAHLECAIQAEMVVELDLALIEISLISAQIHHSKKATKGFESLPQSKVV